MSKNKQKVTGRSRKPKLLYLPASLEGLPPLKPERGLLRKRSLVIQLNVHGKIYTKRHLREHTFKSVH
jgi:hypothetical protein